MFVTQAHSLAQQARLAVTLAWVAGYTNILSVLTCGHVTSHVSGTTSDLGRFTVGGEWAAAGLALFLLGSFLGGAMLSGVAMEIGRRRGWESMYVLPMALQAGLLLLFAVGVDFHEHGTVESGWRLLVMSGSASLAMGLQNATITRISGGVVRTTHVTGVLTDLGTELVQHLWRLRDRALGRRVQEHAEPAVPVEGASGGPATAWRLVLLASVVGSFAFGAALGTLAYREVLGLAMFPPVAFLVLVIVQDLRHPIAEIEPSRLESESQLTFPVGLEVFHLRRDARRPGWRRSGGVHRMPNLVAWSERLPGSARVIVLDLGDVTLLSQDSVWELRAALRALRGQGRRLILAGLDHQQTEQLRRAGVAELLDPSCVCPDLDLAIARGMVLLGGVGTGA